MDAERPSSQSVGLSSEDQSPPHTAAVDIALAPSPRFLHQTGGTIIQLPAETIKLHPITFIHNNVDLGTLDIDPWSTFQKAIRRISEKLGVKEDSLELQFNGKKVRSNEKPFNVGIKPRVPSSITVRIVLAKKTMMPWYLPDRVCKDPNEKRKRVKEEGEDDDERNDK